MPLIDSISHLIIYISPMRVKLINKSHHPAPHYATSGAAGMDIRANLSEPIVLEPLERCLKNWLNVLKIKAKTS